MKINTTKGDINNPSYTRELILTKISENYKDINYLKNIEIGGLNEITLKRENSTITKYEGKEYIKENSDASRRWYGEIYIPSSTVVIDNKTLPEVLSDSKIIENISNRKGILEKGYILITFENIETQIRKEAYLNYEILRNVRGEIISPETPSVLFKEKEGKEKIKLPNGKEIKNMPENLKIEEAPIIIYDVSLRANIDYESTGTH